MGLFNRPAGKFLHPSSSRGISSQRSARGDFPRKGWFYRIDPWPDIGDNVNAGALGVFGKRNTEALCKSLNEERKNKARKCKNARKVQASNTRYNKVPNVGQQRKLTFYFLQNKIGSQHVSFH